MKSSGRENKSFFGYFWSFIKSVLITILVLILLAVLTAIAINIRVITLLKIIFMIHRVKMKLF